MKPWLFFIACCLWSSTALSAQAETRDSIVKNEERLARLDPSSPERMPVCNELAFLYFEYDNAAKANAYAQDAYAQATALGNRAEQAKSLVVFGHLAREKGAFNEAGTHYQEAMKLRNELQDYWGAASCYNSFATLFLDQESQYERGIEMLRKGLDTLELYSESENRKNRLKAKMLNNLGDLLCRTGDYFTAAQEFEESRRLRPAGQEGPVYINEATCLKRLKYYSLADIKLREGLRLFWKAKDSSGLAKTYLQMEALMFEWGEIDSAQQYWNKAYALNNYLDVTEQLILMRNKGNIDWARGQTDEALTHFHNALDQFKTLKNHAEVAKLFFEIGTIHYEQEKYGLAIENYEKGLHLIDSLSLLVPELERQLYFYLSSAYDVNGELDRAYATNKKYIGSTNALQDNREWAMGQYNKETTELYAQAREQEKRMLEKNRYLTISSILAIAFLLSAFIVAVLIALKINDKKALALQQKQLAEQALDNALQELEIESNYSLLDESERIMKSVSQKLHDRLGGMLSTIKLYFVDLNKKISALREENKEQFDKANSLLDELAEEVRRISRDASPANLPDLGLIKKVESMIEHIRNTRQIEVEFVPHNMQQRLEPSKERKLYRIIQILVSNVLVNSKASWFSLQINRFDDELVIMVEDNGIGFDPEEVKSKEGTGLPHLYSLCAQLGATIQYDREMKKGTAATVRMPILSNTFKKQS